MYSLSLNMVADSEKTDGGPGVLYYDPTPTSAKLATATLRLAGYRVFFASSRRTAVEQCRVHGPGGDRSIVTLLLDASADAAESAAVLGELARVPGAADRREIHDRRR